jgi:hypothetical protein
MITIFKNFKQIDMKHRRSFLTKILYLLPGIGLAGGTAITAQKNKRPIQAKFVHMVYFWLKDSTTAEAFMANTEDFIKKIPEVISYHIGKPAMTPRDVVDNSYSVCLVVTFDNVAGHDAYQDHPTHLDFIDNNKEKWTEVKVYDSIMA